MLNLTPRVWQQRVLPGSPLSLPGDLKHGRMIEDPVTGRMWNFGGDWNGTAGGGSGQQEVYSYDPEEDDGSGNGSGWILEDPYCPAPGVFKYGNPDQITTVYDSTRQLVWMIPGFMSGGEADVSTRELAVPLNQNGNETTVSVVEALNLTGDTWPATGSFVIVNDDLTVEFCTYNGTDTTVLPHRFLNVVRGFGGTPKGGHAAGEFLARSGPTFCGAYTIVRGSLPWTSFTFDTATKEWKVRSKIRRNLAGQNPGNGEGSNNGFYDAVSDKVIRITGTSPVQVRIFNLPDLSFTTESFSGLGTNSVPIGNNDIAYDPVDRIAYIIQPGSNPSTFLKYNVAAHTMTKITGSGVPPRFTIAQSSIGINCFYPKWDTINRKLLWPFVYSFSSGSEFETDAGSTDHTCKLYIYHPTLNTWEADPMNPGPPIFPQGNTWLFNQTHNCLMGTGKTNDPGFMYFYRYASTSPAHRPIGLSAAIR